ncbi:MAG: class I SAM-dependent methyltransferase [Candidatus Electrothrix sp. YB6]
MLFTKFSEISRKKKNKLFFSRIRPDETTRVIDIGSQVGTKYSEGIQFLDIYPWKKNVTAVNLSPQHIKNIRKKYPGVNAQTADALNLPWPDQYFDVAYSNAVIEHVGGAEAQRKFASEVMRVAKKYFITTPNRWYPFEFHLRLPFVSWLPGNAYLKVGSIVRFNHIQKKYMWFAGEFNKFNLLSKRQLSAYFPNSTIIACRVTFMPETFIAVSSDVTPHRVAAENSGS